MLQAIALIAILKTGKPFLQLDPRSNDHELAHVLIDVKARLIITNEDIKKCLQKLVNDSVEVVDIDGLSNVGSDRNPIVHVTSESGAYIKYTTGSTKRAKGVIVPHRSILHSILSFTNSIHFCLEDRWLTIMGNYVSPQFFVHLLNGATFCPFDFKCEGLHRLAPWIERHKITISRMFPGAFRQFVSLLSGKEDFSNLRIIRLGGEPMYRSDLKLFKKHFSDHCILIHSYSSSETRTICSYYLDHYTKIIGHRVPVGYPPHGKEVSVVDNEGNDVPIGQSGEIVVKSCFLPAGYWQRSEETNISFQSSKARAEMKVYRTGDLGRLSADGCLTLLGRIDDRIKIRNFRVDVAEVEATLAEHPALKQVVVSVSEDAPGDLRLIAYYVAHHQPAPTVTALREFVAATLPPCMIPATFVELSEFPMTLRGKVNRAGLPDPGKQRPCLNTLFVEASTPIEGTLTQIWAEVLRLTSVGINDEFFELGGHSLAATRIVSHVIKQFQLELPLDTLFQSPTIASMAAVIGNHQAKRLTQTDLDRLLADLEALSEEEAQPALSNITQNLAS